MIGTVEARQALEELGERIKRHELGTGGGQLRAAPGAGSKIMRKVAKALGASARSLHPLPSGAWLCWPRPA